MADDDSSQEKTEDPTPKRMQEARDQGQIPRSKELNTTVVLLAGTGGLLLFGESIARQFLAIAQNNFEIPREHIFDNAYMGLHLGRAAYDGMSSIVPVLAILLVASIVGPIALGGWLLSAKAMAPKFSRLNPGAGLKRMFSVNALMELAKALAKFLIVASLSLVILQMMVDDILGLGRESINGAMEHAVVIVGWAFFTLSATTIVIAMVDVPFQIWDNSKKLKMTKQQVKDEYKDTEGKPEVKGRIRQLQREIAQRRMMGEVPEADVVITNPTHFSVALKYDPQQAGAPIVVAKGADFMALKIREIAEAHDVPQVRTPPLTRAVYYSTDVDQQVPAGLYLAVAQVLAYVFQIREHEARRGKRPNPLGNLDIPVDLQHD